MATSKKRTTIQLPQEEEKEEADQRYFYNAVLALSHIIHLRNITKAAQNIQPPTKPTIKKRKIIKEDDSEETLKLLIQWNNNNNNNNNMSENPPEHIVGDVDTVEQCSKPVRKQLTESDVKEDQNRLMLRKVQVEKTMLPLLKDSEIPKGTNGLEVNVYGPDGEVHEMMFKLWNHKTPVLTSGWNKFVAHYGLNMHCDCLTIWMFRHKKSRKICFAIDSTRFPIRRQLSRRISNVAFKDFN